MRPLFRWIRPGPHEFNFFRGIIRSQVRRAITEAVHFAGGRGRGRPRLVAGFLAVAAVFAITRPGLGAAFRRRFVCSSLSCALLLRPFL